MFKSYFFELNNFLYNLIPTKIISITTIKARIGKKIAKTDTNEAVAVSVEAIK